LIGESDEDLARLCGSPHLIDRQTCRNEALRRFSPAAMADGYEAIYQRATLAAASDWAISAPTSSYQLVPRGALPSRRVVRRLRMVVTDPTAR
jgi:hypothetical protein